MAALDAVESKEKSLLSAREVLRTASLAWISNPADRPEPSCGAPEEAPRNDIVAAAYRSFRRACTRLARAREEARNVLTWLGEDGPEELCPGATPQIGQEHPLLTETLLRLDCVARAEARIDAKRKELLGKVADAKKKYADADANREELLKKAKQALEELQGLESTLQAVVGALAAAGLEDLAAAARVDALEARLGLASTVLQTFTQAKGDPSSASAPNAVEGTTDSFEVRLAAALPGLRDAVDQLLQPKRIGPLLLRYSYLQSELRAAKDRLEAAKRRRALLERRRDGITSELDLLVEANKNLGFLQKKSCPRTQGFAADYAKASLECKSYALRALALYSNSWSVGRLEQNLAASELVGERHMAALRLSEEALDRWNVLIGLPLTQLVELYGSGIKPNEVAQLLHALGLGAIAVGVN
jgi:vacuolar-type H+-ATPase subunit D/Vma8